jgi:poly-gamma-glutamate synthesis protein (capsule biosynthesis protein)
MKKKTIRFGAVGDLLLNTRPGSDAPDRGLEVLSDDVRELFASCDLVFANLECTLPGRETVPTEPRVVSTETQVRSLQNSGIGIVTLANNHMFDCMNQGFQHISDILTDIGMHWFGAGHTVEDALRPAVLNINGIRLAFLGMVDQTAGPFRFADETTGGVAQLNTEKICQMIREIRRDVDYIIISPHWGTERFRIPSPKQTEQARKFIDAGASMIIGHHPHVLQGMEFYRGAPILYSLGNFIANDLHWVDGDRLTWSRFERTGCILIADMDSDGVRNIQQIPVTDNGEQVFLDTSAWGEKCLRKVNRLLARGVTHNQYKREKFYIEIIKPVLSHLKWSELHRLRPRHFRNALQLIQR